MPAILLARVRCNYAQGTLTQGGRGLGRGWCTSRPGSAPGHECGKWSYLRPPAVGYASLPVKGQFSPLRNGPGKNEGWTGSRTRGENVMQIKRCVPRSYRFGRDLYLES